MHCKAGLGRTGVLICAYMIKHYGFSAHEAMGYIRVCRPGSVIGPQQHYLISVAPKLAQQGAALRRALSNPTADAALLVEGGDGGDENAKPERKAASAQRARGSATARGRRMPAAVGRAAPWRT